jgi:hypothetical protein
VLAKNKLWNFFIFFMIESSFFGHFGHFFHQNNAVFIFIRTFVSEFCSDGGNLRET